MANRPVIRVGVEADLSKFFKELNSDLDKASKNTTVKTEIDDSALKNVRKDVADLQKELKNIKAGNIDSSSLQKTMDLIDGLTGRVTILEKNMFGLSEAMKGTSAGNELKSVLDGITKSMSDTISQSRLMVQAVQEVKKATADTADVRVVGISKDELRRNKDRATAIETELNDFKDNLKREKEEIASITENFIGDDDLASAIDGLASKGSKGFKKLNDALEASFKTFQKTAKQIESFDFRKGSLKDLSNNLMDIFDTSYDIKSVGKLVPQDLADQFLKNSGYEDIIKRIESAENIIQQKLRNEVEALNSDKRFIQSNQKTAVSSKKAATVTDKDGNIKPITVPLNISTNYTTLLRQATEIADKVTDNLTGHPIEVGIVLTSDYARKRNAQFLKNLKGFVNDNYENLSDENKVKLNNLMDSVAGSFENEIKLNIKTNIDDTEKKVKSGIQSIKKALKEEENQLTIYPDVKLSEKTVNQLQDDLNKISTSFKIVIDDIDLTSQAKDRAEKTVADAVIGKENNKKRKKTAEEIWNSSALEEGQEGSGTKSTESRFEIVDTNSVKELKSIFGELQNLAESISASLFDHQALGKWESAVLGALRSISEKAQSAFDFTDVLQKINDEINKVNPDKQNNENTETNKIIPEDIQNEINAINEIKDVINTVSESIAKTDSVINESGSKIESIANSIGEISNNINKATQTLSEFNSALNTTDGSAKAVQSAFEEVQKTGRIDSRMNVFKDFYTQLENYRKLGGTATLSDLTGADDKTVGKLQNQIQKYSVNQNKKLESDNLLNSQNIAETVSQLKSLVDVLDKASVALKEVQTDGLNINANTTDSLFSKDNATTLKNIVDALVGLKDIKISGDDAQNISNIQKSITNLSKVNADQLKAVTSALKDMFDALKQPVDSNSFTSALSQIASNGKYFKDINKVMSAPQTKVTNAKKIVDSNGDDGATDVKQYNQDLKDLQTNLKTYYDLTDRKTSGIITQSELDKLETANSEIVRLLKSINSVNDTSIDIKGDLSKIYNEVGNAYTETQEKSVAKMIDKLNEQTTKNELKGSPFLDDYKKQIDEAISAQKELQDIIASHPKGTPYTNEDITNIIGKKNTISDIYNDYTNPNNIQAKTQVLDKIITKAQDDLQKHSGMPKELSDQLEGLIKSASDARENIDLISKATATSLGDQQVYLHSQATKYDKSFGDKVFSSLTSANAQFIGQYFSFQDIIRYGQEAFQTIQKLDNEMVELAKVSNASGDVLNQTFQDAANMAQELGVSVDNVLTSITDWNRLGYSIQDSKTLAHTTELFEEVGDNMSQESSQETLTSVLKGFNMQADQSMQILDSINEVILLAALLY